MQSLHGFDQNTYHLAVSQLDAAYIQHKGIAANIANKEVPGYQRVKVADQFDKDLQECWRQGRTQDLAQLKPQLITDSTASILRPDGNNVSLEDELIQLSNNNLRFEFGSEVISDSLHQLQVAITGKTQ